MDGSALLRVLVALAQQRAVQSDVRNLREQAEAMNAAARQFELSQMGQAILNANYTRPHVFIGPGGLDPRAVPLGLDQGMVRTASIAADIGRDLAKSAGIGQQLFEVAKGIGQVGAQAAKYVGRVGQATGKMGLGKTLAMGTAGVGLAAAGIGATRTATKAMSGEAGPVSYALSKSLPTSVNNYGYTAQRFTP